MAERFSLQEWIWIEHHEKNRELSWICTVQRYKREKSKPTALKYSQLKKQKTVVCRGTWWNKYTVTLKSWHPNPTAVKPEKRSTHLPLCYYPGISRAFSSWEQNVVLPVPFSWCPLPGGIGLPLEWHGTHNQLLLTLISKDVLKLSSWLLESEALLWCCFSANLHCVFVLCNCYYCADRGRVAVFFGFISQEF